MKAVIRQEDWSKGKIIRTQKFEYDIVLNKRIEVAYRDACETQVFDDETRNFTYKELLLAFTPVDSYDGNVVFLFEGEAVCDSYVDNDIKFVASAFARVSVGGMGEMRTNTLDSGSTFYFTLVD